MSAKSVKLPKVNDQGFYEIRMESIGGFGANLAGKILGEAGVLHMGLNGSNFSSYGSEKKGSPVKAFVRFCDSKHPVRVNSPVTEPDIVVIFQEAMVNTIPVIQGIQEDSVVIVCTSKTPDEAREMLKLPAGTLVCLDAIKIALEEKTRVNTALLGAICKHSGFIDPEAVKNSIKRNLGKKYSFLVPANLKTFDRGFEEGVSKHYKYDRAFPYQPFSRSGQKIGYKNQPMGGTLPNFGSTITKDLTTSRMGMVPVLHQDKCTHCGECDITCPDYCFEWASETNAKGKEVQVLTKIRYQHCKGCMRCVEICKFDALTAEEEASVSQEILKAGFKKGDN